MAVLNNQRVISSDVLGQIGNFFGDLMGIEAAKMVNTIFKSNIWGFIVNIDHFKLSCSLISALSAQWMSAGA